MSSSSMLVAKYLTSLQMLIEDDATSHKTIYRVFRTLCNFIAKCILCIIVIMIAVIAVIATR